MRNGMDTLLDVSGIVAYYIHGLEGNMRLTISAQQKSYLC